MPPDDQTTAEPEVSDDLKSLLSAAFDEHEVRQEPTERTEQSDSRPRAPDGKFAKAEKTESEAETGAAETDAPAKPADEEKPATEQPVAAAAEPPGHWKAEDKQTFAALPAEAQQFLLRRHGEMEADYTRKTQQHAAFVRDYDPVRQILAPHEAQIRQAGFTPATLIQAWSNVEKALMEGRGVDIVRDLVANYRLDKAQIARAIGLTANGTGSETPPVPEGHQPIALPPEVVSTIQRLEQQGQQFNQFLTAQQEQQRREAESRVEGTITAFRNAKDSSGNLLHPHYDDLEADMVRLWKAAAGEGQQPTLDEIYDQAVWANTSTRQKQLEAQSAAAEAQRQKAEKQRQDEARAKAERARKAASSVTGAPGSGQSRVAQAQAEGGSLRDQLNAAFEELSDA